MMDSVSGRPIPSEVGQGDRRDEVLLHDWPLITQSFPAMSGKRLLQFRVFAYLALPLPPAQCPLVQCVSLTVTSVDVVVTFHLRRWALNVSPDCHQFWLDLKLRRLYLCKNGVVFALCAYTLTFTASHAHVLTLAITVR